jgi:hypothetical protein
MRTPGKVQRLLQSGVRRITGAKRSAGVARVELRRASNTWWRGLNAPLKFLFPRIATDAARPWERDGCQAEGDFRKSLRGTARSDQSEARLEPERTPSRAVDFHKMARPTYNHDPGVQYGDIMDGSARLVWWDQGRGISWTSRA